MTDTDPRPNPVRAALGRALELALQRVVALDPDTAGGLAALEGREVALALQAPAVALRIAVRDGVLRVLPDRGAEPDLGVRATLGAVLGQLLPGRERGLPVGQVRISGDAELARRLQQLQQRYEPDLEEAFSRVLGDVAGVQLARALRGAWGWSRDTAASLARDAAEFVTEESRDVVPKAELEAFLDEVDALRDDVERLERRIARLGSRAH